MSKLISVELTFTRERRNGETETIRADLGPEDGWNQWGAPTQILGENVDALEAVQEALSEHWN